MVPCRLLDQYGDLSMYSKAQTELRTASQYLVTVLGGDWRKVNSVNCENVQVQHM